MRDAERLLQVRERAVRQRSLRALVEEEERLVSQQHREQAQMKQLRRHTAIASNLSESSHTDAFEACIL